MLYLIGGAHRVGKSTLARLLLRRKQVPYVSADILTWALDETYPMLGIRAGRWEDIPERFYPFLNTLLRHADINQPQYCIEGDSFFPVHAAQLRERYGARTVFLGNSRPELATVLKYEGHCPWVSHQPAAKQKGIAVNIARKSAMFKRECAKHHIPYIDMAGRHKRKLEEAYAALTA
jgi:hypothetical protein